MNTSYFVFFFSFSDLKSLFLTLYLYPLPSPPSVAPGSGAVAAYSRLTGIFTETRLHRLTMQSGTCCYVTMSLFFLSPLPPDSYHTEAVTPPAHYPLTYYPTACNEWAARGFVVACQFVSSDVRGTCTFDSMSGCWWFFPLVTRRQTQRVCLLR